MPNKLENNPVKSRLPAEMPAQDGPRLIPRRTGPSALETKPTVTNTNEVLPAKAREEVTSLLSLARQELARIEEMFFHAHSTLQDISALRDDIVSRISTYQIALAAHKKLPPEILAEIFLYFVTDTTTLPSKRFEAPWVLGHVCSRWRAVVVNLSQLWCNVHLKFNSRESFNHRSLVDMANEFLSRGSSQITLKISAHGLQRLAPSSVLVSDLIVLHARRLRHLSIFGAQPLTPFYWLRHASFWVLESLEVCGLDMGQVEDMAVLHAGQTLRKVTLSGPQTRLRMDTISLPWSHLHELDLKKTILPFLTGCDILRQCTRLVSCSFCLQPENTISRVPPIILKRLTSLAVSVARSGAYGEFLRPFFFPALKNLELDSQSDAWWDHSELVSLLIRSSCFLESFTGNFLSQEFVVELLSHTPSLRELCLTGQDPVPLILDMISSSLFIPRLEALTCSVFVFDYFIEMLDRQWLASQTSTGSSTRSAIRSVNIICRDNCARSKDGWRLLQQLRLEGMDIAVMNAAGEPIYYNSDDYDDHDD